MAIYYPQIHSSLGKLFQKIVVLFILAPIYYLIFKLEVINKDKIPKDKLPFVIMPNHLSNLDPPLIAVATGLPVAFMAKVELFKVPILRQLIILLGAFSVNREKVEKTSIKATKEIIKKNWCVGMFLEGTRNKTPGKLSTPNSGPPFIANLNKVPILPIGIINSNEPLKGIKVIIGDLFYPEKDLEKAKLQCANELSKLTGFKMPD